MQVEIGSRTDIGRVRKNNEDACRVLPDLNLFVISDGMGGEASGEVASAIVAETIAGHCSDRSEADFASDGDALRDDLSETTNRLADAVRLANHRIHELSQEHPELRGMGATVVTAWLEGDRLSLVHVGDSRAYLLRSGVLTQLTSDHSLVAEQVRRGLITPEQSRSSKMQNVLIRALGARETVDLDASELTLFPEDVLLLCTDGLTRMVDDSAITNALLDSSDAQMSADSLVLLANENGGEDNVTAIVVRLDDIGQGERSHRKWVRRIMNSFANRR